MRIQAIHKMLSIWILTALLPLALHAQTTPSALPTVAVELPGKSTSGPHGGSLKSQSGLLLETLVSTSGIKMYVYDRSGEPIAVEGGRGAASLRIEGDAKRYRYDLLPDGKGALTAPVNFERIAGRQVELQLHLVGLPGIGNRLLSFTEVTSLPASEEQVVAASVARQKICPVSGKPLGSMGQPVAVDINGKTVFACCSGCVDAIQANPHKYASGRPPVLVSTATAEDQALIARQINCPVMDEPLGSMGTPVKALVGDKPVFLCCKGCIKKLEAEPAKYVSMVHREANQAAVSSPGSTSFNPQSVPAAGEQVRPGVFKVTPAEKPFIAAQKTCPVMDEPLDSMGGPYRVHADGKAIYICCPGCAKKIADAPGKYLEILAQKGIQAPSVAALVKESTVPAGSEQVRPGIFKVVDADAPFVEAQQKCPVMDEPLNAMGGPFKVHAQGKAIYICCPGCAKRISAKPEFYLSKLADQGIDPPVIR